MTNISRDEVKRLAKFAKLELTKAEVQKFQKQLSEVIGYFEALKKVKTEGVEPTSQVTGLTNVWRPDLAVKSLTAKEALSGIKDIRDGMFKTDIVITK